MPSWKKVIVSGSNAELLSVTASFLGNLAGTASFANNATSASYALTASYVRIAESTSFAPNLYNSDGTLPNSTRTVTFLSSTILRFDLSSSIAGSPRVLFDTANVASGVRFTGSGYVNLDTTAVSLAGVSNLAQANIIGRDSLGALTYFSTSSIKLVQSASFAATASYFSGSIANAILADSASRVLVVYDDQPLPGDIYYLTYTQPISGTYEFLQNDRSLRYDSGIRTLYATNFSGAFSGSLFGTAATASFAPNIYNSNGALNGSRLVDLNGQDLTFNADGGDFIIISNPANTVSIESLTTGSAENILFHRTSDGKLFSYPTSSFTASFALTSSYVSGAVVAPGSNTQVVFNNAGVLGANSGLVYSGSRVGIGVATPSQSLDLRGSMQISGSILPFADSVSYLGDIASRFIGIYARGLSAVGNSLDLTGLNFNLINSAGSTLVRLVGATGNLGIGTTLPSASLHISGAAASTLLQIHTPTIPNLLLVTGSGFIGVNRIPAVRLDVSGDIRSDSTVYTSQLQAQTVRINSATHLTFQNTGSGETARYDNSGNWAIGVGTFGSARLHVRGAGATSATNTFILQNSTPVNLMTVTDNGQFAITSPLISLSPSQSAFSISQSISQSATVGAQVYGVNITPTFFATTNGQTETAFRVNATFTGSAAATGSSNIIADFGATSAGSQLTITDVTSGSIYMVNDVSGLPIVEATSDWTFNLYNYPNIILQKTGSTVNISGSLRVTGSASLVGLLAVTGSVSASSYTGSLLGTASFANNTTSASFASTASYVLQAVSASFATSASVARSASFAQTAQSATSASFAVNAVNAVNAENAYVEENDIDATYYLVLANNTADYIRLSADKNNANYNASTGTLTVVQLVETSARRFKENIEPLKGSLERVQQLQGVSFNRVGDTDKKIGFIAEDVAEVYPELVEYNKEGEVQGLAYQRTVAVLVEAVKELTDKLQAQEVFIKDLESRIKNLETN